MTTIQEMLAKRLKHFDSSLIRQAFDRADDIPGSIDLSIGFPEDATPDYIKAAGIRAVEENFTRYTPSNGIVELRTAVAEKLRRENNIKVSPDEISITPGLTTAIMLTYLALLDPEDEVILPDPYFPPYRDLAKLVGAVPILVDTYPSFQLTAKMLEPLITAKTKLIIINSPNNPSGAVYPERELRKIAALAKRNNIFILSDEIYEHFSYDEKHFSIGSIYPKTITLNGFSKAYAMTGWRVGYIAAPKEFINGINQLQQYVVFSSSSIAQKAAAAALRKSPSKLTRKYKAKRDIVHKYLDTRFEIYGSQGAFYAYMRLPQGVDDLMFAEAAARHGVIVIPSRAFSTHTDHIRIAFAIKHSDLVSGLKRICRTIDELQDSQAKKAELAVIT